MTSPCEAVLTSSPTMTFTPNSAAFSAASRAPEISLWSVTAIAPSPWSRAVASSTSTGVAQSGEWSVCMCRSTSIFVRAATLRRTGPSGGGWWRRAASAAYTDSSSSARRSKPMPSRMPAPAAASEERSAASPTRRPSWAASTSTSRGSNSRPRSPSPTSSS